MTVDAAGTILELEDPVEALRDALAKVGVVRDPSVVRRAFRAEVAYYVPRSHEGRDGPSLADLRRRSVAVFLEAADAEADAAAFVPAFMGAVRFRPVGGAEGALGRLRGEGLRIACVANWDVSLSDHLERAGLASLFDTVVTSAEAGAPKPAPEPFRLALSRLHVRPAHALHVGDDAVDRDGARAAGLAFAPVPVATLPARLGIR